MNTNSKWFLPRGHYKLMPPRQTVSEVMMLYEQIRAKFKVTSDLFGIDMNK